MGGSRRGCGDGLSCPHGPQVRARATLRPRPLALKRRGNTQNRQVVEAASHDLHSGGQSACGNARRHRYRRQLQCIELHRHIHAHQATLLVASERAQLVVVDGRGRDRLGGADQGVASLENGKEPLPGLREHRLGEVQLCCRQAQPILDRGDDGRVHLLPDGLQMMPEMGRMENISVRPPGFGESRRPIERDLFDLAARLGQIARRRPQVRLDFGIDAVAAEVCGQCNP
jgi:hypothetical protein